MKTYTLRASVLAALLCLSIPSVPAGVGSNQDKGLTDKLSGFTLDELIGEWKNTLDPQQTVKITKGLVPADTSVYFQGQYRWQGQFDAAASTFTFEKEVFYFDINSEIPAWAHEPLSDQFGTMRYKIHLRLKAVHVANAHCPVMLVGEWYPGEVEWKESTHEVLPAKGPGPRQFVSYSRTGEGLESCDELQKLIADRSKAYQAVEETKGDLDSKLRQVEGDLSLSQDRYNTVKKYIDDYEAAVEKAKTVEDIAGLTQLVGAAAAKKILDARKAAKAAETIGRDARAAEKAAELAANQQKAKEIIAARKAAIEKATGDIANNVAKTPAELEKQVDLAVQAGQLWDAGVANDLKLQELQGLVDASLAQNKTPTVSVDLAMKIKADPQAMRSLKSAPIAVRQAFYDAESGVNRAHADKLLKFVSQNSKGQEWEGKELVVHEFRTPGAPAGSINTDRDYRVLYRVGPDQWKEVPRGHWDQQSARFFAEASGFAEISADGTLKLETAKLNELASKADLEKWAKMSGQELQNDQLEKWAQLHQQLATDKYHLEASRDFSDQEVRAGQWAQKRSKVEDPSMDNWLGRANVQDVAQGSAVLDDPQRMGMMYKFKIQESLDLVSAAHPEGDRLEALAQAKKAFAMLDDMRTGYIAQGLDVGNLPDRLAQARDAVKRLEPFDASVTNDKLAAVEDELRKIFSTNPNDPQQLKQLVSDPVATLADLIDSQFYSLKAAEDMSKNPLIKAAESARELGLPGWTAVSGEPALLDRLSPDGLLDVLGNPYTHLLLAVADITKIIPRATLDSEKKEMVSQAAKAKKELLEAEEIWGRLSDSFDRAGPVDDLYKKLDECRGRIPADQRECLDALSREQIKLLEEQYDRLKQFVTRIRDLRKNFDHAAMYEELHKELNMKDLAGVKLPQAKAESDAAMQAWNNSRPRSSQECPPLGCWPERERAEAAHETYQQILSQVEAFTDLEKRLPASLKFSDLAAVLEPSTAAVDTAQRRVAELKSAKDQYYKAHNFPAGFAPINIYTGRPVDQALAGLNDQLERAEQDYKTALSEAAGVGRLAALSMAVQSTVRGIRTGSVSAAPWTAH
jgi:hypothetical protein